MNLPDTHDHERTLWGKLLTNLGGTDSANADLRAQLAALLALLTA